MSSRNIPGASTFVLALCVGCDHSGLEIETPVLDPSAVVAKALEDYDSDGDGSISATEIEGSPGLRAAAVSIDTDKNGVLSASEIEDRIVKLRALDLALIPFSCEVLLDGRPVVGAQVRLVPEAFMGPDVKSASGTTDSNGWVTPVVEGQSALHGMHLGIYRVEISKKGGAGLETLPSRYNSNTTLGQQVALDVSDREHGVTYHLSSK